MSLAPIQSSIPADLDWDRDDRTKAFEQLSAVRRRNRVAALDKFDAFYKAYVSAIFGAVVVYAITGWLGSKALTQAQMHDFVYTYPRYAAVAIAALFILGLRSGSRGGPLALEQQSVRHVLLAPVAREDVLRGAARRSLMHAAFLGAVLGAIAGAIAARRLPHNYAFWVLAFGVLGVAVAVGATATALVLSGTRTRAAVADLLSVFVLIWVIADIVLKHTTSPFSWLAQVALWPMHFDFKSAIALAMVLVLCAIGYYLAPGWSLEVAERRSRLVGQLRFAATMQDLRTVMVLQRQLSQQHMRVRPLIKTRTRRPENALDAKGQPRMGVFIRRSFQSLMRWPLSRAVRFVLVSMIAGVAAFGGWQVSPAMFAITGLAFWIIALDLVEPLAQEADRPERLALLPRGKGWAYIRLLWLPIVMQAVAYLIGAATCYAIATVVGGEAGTVVNLGLATFTVGVVVPVVAAAIVVIRGPGSGAPSSQSGSISPEITGFLTIWRVGFPPLLAVGAFVPLMFAQREFVINHDLGHVARAMQMSWNVVFALGMFGLMWIRYSEQIQEQMSTATEERNQKLEVAKQEAVRKSEERKKSNRANGAKSK